MTRGLAVASRALAVASRALAVASRALAVASRAPAVASRALAVAAVVCAAGCSSASIDVALRVPSGDHPLAGADAVSVTLRDAAGQPLAFTRGPAAASALDLPHVAGGSGFTLDIEATFGPDALARGRSCSFDVDVAHPPTVPVWFSRVGHFGATAGPDMARSDADVFAWGTGALLAGGASNGSPLASTELYDPTTGRFAAGPLLSTPRAGARAVLIAPGTVLIIGGAQKGAPALEALTASHTTPEPAGLAPDIVDHAATAAGDGSVVVAGGRVGGTPTDAAWLITQAGASVEPLPPMLHARAALTLTATSDDEFAPLYAIGGVDASGPVAAIEAYDPATEAFADTSIHLVTPRSQHTVTRLPSGLLLVVGGVDAAGAPIATAEIVDPVGRSARVVADLRIARSQHAATLLPSGRVLVSGGVDGNGMPLADAEIFDPALGAEGDFVPTSPLDTPRAGHMLAPLCDGTFLVVGGASGAEIYNPL